MATMLRTAARDLARLRRITGLIGKYGYDELIRRGPGLPDDLESQDFRPVDGEAAPPQLSAPKRFRLMLEELGPTFIKFGQVLSSRPDLVSKEYVDELRSLQDHCEPLPYPEILSAIRLGLGSEPLELFAEIDPEPLATASIAQVHRGLTRDGTKVVIKVQRPGIAEEVRGDVEILYRVAKLLNAVVEESSMAEPVGIVREFDKALTEELNFQHEAANLREFARLHEPRRDIVVPIVFPELSSTTILTMSRLEGVPFSRLPEGCDKKAIAARIIKEAFDEVFIDGVFHADPHPGNLMFLDDGRYGILDLGLLGRLSPSMQETLVVLALAIAVRDADTIARTLYRLGQADQRVDLAEVKADTVLLLQRYADRQIREVDSALLLQELLSLGMKHRLRIPAEYTMLGRAGATIEGIVRGLDPNLDVVAVAKPYAEKLLVDRVAPAGMEGGLYKAMLQFQGLSQDMPIQLSQILADVSSGRFGVAVGGPSLDRLSTSILTAATILSGAILGGAFVIGAFIGLSQLDLRIQGIPVLGIMGALSAATLVFWVGVYAVLRPRLKKVSVLRWFRR
jgi:ubiquinone biosynthesis protein